MNVAIIPAYNPDGKLIELVDELRKIGLDRIIVVDDGSAPQNHNIFESLLEKATVLAHTINQGKGAAIKTALRYVNNLPELEGVVLLDADGQHRPQDAIRLLEMLHNSSSDMVLGVRTFEGEIPLRSLFGNTITKYVFRLFSGKWVSDTQTGLRAFTTAMLPSLIAVSGDRYEYEMNVLLTCTKKGVKMTEVPIATIYHDESNSCSHFRAFRDSARIYGNILVFSGASFLSFLLDYMIFFPFVWMLSFGFQEGIALIGGNIAARLISAAFNYYLNSTYVFRNNHNKRKSVLSYALLACTILVLNSAILYFLHDFMGVKKAIAKLITEMLLFVISYSVQRFVIFNKTKKEEAGVIIG